MTAESIAPFQREILKRIDVMLRECRASHDTVAERLWRWRQNLAGSLPS